MATQRYDAIGLATFASHLLVAAGMTLPRATVVARILVEGDLMGHTTHGLQLMGPYLKSIAKNEMLLDLLTQQQRVAQAGLVTAGLAHDVDNHVQVIIGSAYLACRRDDPEGWKAALNKIQEQCVALTETTRAFLGFVRRRDTLGNSEFDIAQVLDESRRLAQPLARRHGVEIAVDVAQACAKLQGERRLATVGCNIAV